MAMTADDKLHTPLDVIVSPRFTREAVDRPRLFGLAWPVFGVAAALSTIATARLFGRANRRGPSAISSWPLGSPCPAYGSPR